MPEDNSDIFVFKNACPDSFMFFDSIHYEEPDGILCHDMDDFSALQQHQPLHTLTGGGLTATTVVGALDSTTGVKNTTGPTDDVANASKNPQDTAEFGPEQNDDLSDEHASYNSEFDHRLPSLNLDLSKQLQQYLAISRPQSQGQQNEMQLDISTHSPPSANGGKTTGKEDQLSSQLLGDALNDTSEFLAILQSHLPEAKVNSNGPRVASTSHPRLGIIVILNLLSVHLQLVVIYDKLLKSLNNQLFDGLDTLPASGGGLQLTGFSAKHGNLQSKILIHAILHQFEMIERILGLPAEFRVTEKRDDHSGLLEGRCAKRVLEAIGGEQGGGDGALRDQEGLRSLYSLREMLKSVQVSLNM